MKNSEPNKKNVLMIALDFPPCQSPGVQRTKSFYQNLPKFGWEPHVLTAQPIIYDKISHEVDSNSNVSRAFGLNTTKHMSIKGKYFGFTALPDRYWSWYWHAVYLGKKIIKREKPDVIWATFPCSTAMRIATKLSDESGIPLVTDYRDPFIGHYSENIIGYKQRYKIDRAAVEKAKAMVFCTSNMVNLYKDNYTLDPEMKIHTITNGYSEQEFLAAEKQKLQTVPTECVGKTVILHSGGLYENGRNPVKFILAFKRLTDEQCDHNYCVAFRGCKPYEQLAEQIEILGLGRNISFLNPIPYGDSLIEMINSEILLLIQGQIFDNQVPGKAYDYLRSGRAILALTPEGSSTHKILAGQEGVVCADPESEEEIYSALVEISKFAHKRFNRDDIGQYERESLSEKLASVLDEVSAS